MPCCMRHAACMASSQAVVTDCPLRKTSLENSPKRNSKIGAVFIVAHCRTQASVHLCTGYTVLVTK